MVASALSRPASSACVSMRVERLIVQSYGVEWCGFFVFKTRRSVLWCFEFKINRDEGDDGGGCWSRGRCVDCVMYTYLCLLVFCFWYFQASKRVKHEQMLCAACFPKWQKQSIHGVVLAVCVSLLPCKINRLSGSCLLSTSLLLFHLFRNHRLAHDGLVQLVSQNTGKNAMSVFSKQDTPQQRYGIPVLPLRVLLVRLLQRPSIFSHALLPMIC